MRRGARGFSLLELVAASVMILSITGVALAIMLTVYFTQVEAQIRNAATRDAQLILDTIGEDLRYFGVGVPYGSNVQTSIGPTNSAAIQLRPALRVAEAEYIAFLGDLPYPNADFNGLAQVTDLKGTGATGADDEYAVLSELSGCVPPASGGVDCNTQTASPAWGGAAPAPACAEGDENAPSCPWALNKWQNNATSHVELVLGASTGVWALLRWDMSSFGNVRGQRTIHADHDYPASGAHIIQRAPFVDNRAGGSMLAHLDRVFYSLERSGTTTPCAGTQDCVLKRRQCWGPLGLPSFANFPAAGTASASVGYSGGNPGNCGPSNGTPWEPITGAIEAMRFRYFDDTGAEIATPIATAANLSRVASIEVTVAVRRRVRAAMMPNFEKFVSQRMTRRFALANNGPWVDSFACESPTAPGSANCAFEGNP